MKYVLQKFDFEAYENSELDLDLLNLADKQVTSRVLLLEPLHVNAGRKGIYTCLRKYKSIEEIKKLLSQTNDIHINMLQVDCDGVAEKRIQNIVKAIEFYEQQVIRTVQLYGEMTNKNEIIFFIDKDKKDKIVKENMVDIAEYLFSMGSYFITGENIKYKEDKIIERMQTGKDNFTVNEFVNAISNYTTIEELEDSKLRTKALKRFMY